MGMYSFTSHVLMMTIFVLQRYFVPEFAHFFFAQLFFFFSFFMIWHVVLMQNNKTGACGCECSIFQSVNDSICVSVCECAGESSLQMWLDPRLFYGSIIFELALQLFFIQWTFFVHKPENTLVQFEFFFTLHWGSPPFLPPSVFPPLQLAIPCLYHCCFIPVNTSMYIPRPKHLRIQVTHGTHL